MFKLTELADFYCPRLIEIAKENYSAKYGINVDEISHVDVLTELSLVNPRLFGIVIDFCFLIDNLKDDSKLIV